MKYADASPKVPDGVNPRGFRLTNTNNLLAESISDSGIDTISRILHVLLRTLSERPIGYTAHSSHSRVKKRRHYSVLCAEIPNQRVTPTHVRCVVVVRNRHALRKSDIVRYQTSFASAQPNGRAGSKEKASPWLHRESEPCLPITSGWLARGICPAVHAIRVCATA
jgi:hypothetical protein